MREDGFGSDAGRPSLTEVGVAGAHASFQPTCRLCGVACASGTKFCPNCGAIQRAAGPAIESRSRTSEPLPPLPPARIARSPVGAEAAPAGASSSPHRAGDALRAAMPTSSHPTAARGERLVAWSALGVLLIASVFVIQRLGDLRGAMTVAPVRVAVTTTSIGPLPAPERSATSLPAGTADLAPGLSPARETIAAARHAAKPASRPKAHASRKPPARSAAHSRPSTQVAAVALSPVPASARPETVLVATASDDTRTHWEAMHDEISACSTRDFLEGVMCQQRVRIRYCEGWWGHASDCPSRRDDYGN
jgi:hypothetical protein